MATSTKCEQKRRSYDPRPEANKEAEGLAMSINRYAARPDKNQEEIIAGLRKLGFTVDIVRRPYDLIVTGWKFGLETSLRVEVKAKGGRMTPAEKKYHDTVKHKDTLIIAYNIEDILSWFNSSISLSSSNGAAIFASVDVVSQEPMHITPLYITSSEQGKAVTRKSTTPAILSSSITMNTSKGNSTRGHGGKSSGKSRSSDTAKKK